MIRVSEDQQARSEALEQERDALERFSGTGEMNPEAQKSMETFCKGVAERIQAVIDGKDDWIDKNHTPEEAEKIREHYRSAARKSVRTTLRSPDSHS